MRKLTFGIIVLFVILLVSISCSRAPAPAPVTVSPGTTSGKMSPPAPSIAIPPAPMPTAVPRPTPAPAPPMASGSSQASDSANIVDRMIVRTGQISLLVDDLPAALDSITKLAENRKGYVVSSNSWREGERLRGTITIRVPSGDFDAVMRSLAQLAVEVTSQSATSKDVTEEYTDLGARLQNLQATEQQLLKIMQQATKVEDILAIQRELTNTRGQIEQIKARMLYLERTSATSLINITLDQAKLDVKLTGDRVSVKAGESIRFTSQVAGGRTPYSFVWDFGDGTTSTDVAPTHAYKSTGSYTVSVKVTDDRANTDTESRKDYITVLPGWSAGNIFSSAWSGLGAFGRGLADVLIWVGVFSPVWIVGGGIGYLVWRRRRKTTRA